MLATAPAVVQPLEVAEEAVPEAAVLVTAQAVVPFLVMEESNSSPSGLLFGGGWSGCFGTTDGILASCC